MPAYLSVIAADLDKYEADRRVRADLQARYDAALQRWDQLEMARVAALAATYDVQHPGEAPVLDGVLAPRYPAAA